MGKNNMTNGRHTRMHSRLWLWLLLLGCAVGATAQDRIPDRLSPQDTLRNPVLHVQHGTVPLHDPVTVGNSLPRTFRNAGTNCILRAEQLSPFFEKLCQGTEPVRIVQLGDSHVRGHVFSVAARHTLEAHGAVRRSIPMPSPTRRLPSPVRPGHRDWSITPSASTAPPLPSSATRNRWTR